MVPARSKLLFQRGQRWLLKASVARWTGSLGKQKLPPFISLLVAGALLQSFLCLSDVAAHPSEHDSVPGYESVTIQPSSPLRASSTAEGVTTVGQLREHERRDLGGTRYLSSLHFVAPETAVTMVVDERFVRLGKHLIATLERTHSHYETLFGEIPGFAVTVRLLDEETFFLSTGAPRWTNALYYRGQIMIPLPVTSQIDFDNVSRSVRHEYTHAVIHALSNGKTPGWIDEGLAQLAEGLENPALRQALYDFLRSNQPVSFQLMQGGFTKLESGMVAAAYAQSLIAAEALVETFGFSKLRRYFTALRGDSDHHEAFRRVFGMPEHVFEDRFVRKLNRWVRTSTAPHLSVSTEVRERSRGTTATAVSSFVPLWDQETSEATRAQRELVP